MKASVLIPTKNGGVLFKEVLNKVRNQETKFDFEIVVIDSGSKDGTLEYLHQISKTEKILNVYTIPPKDFGHGKTRNYGVSLSKGEFVALLTQDSLPTDKFWLTNLIESFNNDEEIAGVFGKHIPYEWTYPVEKKQIIDHFDIGFGKKWQKIKIEDKEDYSAKLGWYIFFSDNNACIRKSVWKKIPYPEVEMAEDQLWAKAILEAGFAKAYAPNAVVFHSHKYSFKEIIKRYYDEYKFHNDVGTFKKASVGDTLKFYAKSYIYSLRVISKNRNIFSKFKWALFYLLYDLVRSIGYFQGTNSTSKKDKKYSLQRQIIND